MTCLKSSNLFTKLKNFFQVTDGFHDWLIVRNYCKAIREVVEPSSSMEQYWIVEDNVRSKKKSLQCCKLINDFQRRSNSMFLDHSCQRVDPKLFENSRKRRRDVMTRDHTSNVDFTESLPITLTTIADVILPNISTIKNNIDLDHSYCWAPKSTNDKSVF